MSIYIDDELLEKLKERKPPLSAVVRDALKEYLEKEVKEEDYDFIEKSLVKTLTTKGEKAWKEVQKERDRW